MCWYCPKKLLNQCPVLLPGCRYSKILVVALLLTLLALFSVDILHFDNSSLDHLPSTIVNQQVSNTILPEDQSTLVVVDPRLVEIKRVDGASCISTYFREKQFPICLYSSTDLISSYFHSGIYWEEVFVSIVLSKLERDPQFGFIDIGANVGAYALAAAHVCGREVVAVEATKHTSRLLAFSLRLGNISDNVTVLQNAISGNRRKLYMAALPNNLGSAKAFKSCSRETSGRRICLNDEVNSITLNDLLHVIHFKKAIMKIDAEGAEIDIMTNSTSDLFFQTIHIPVIQMEWVFYTMFYTNSKIKMMWVDKLVEYMQNKNYSAYSMHGNRLAADWTKWPLDILWQKEQIQRR